MFFIFWRRPSKANAFSTCLNESTIKPMVSHNVWAKTMNRINESNQWIEWMNRVNESNQWIEPMIRINESNQRVESMNRIHESNQWIESVNRVNEVLIKQSHESNQWIESPNLQYTPYTSCDFLNGFRKSPWTPHRYRQEIPNPPLLGFFTGII